MDTQIAITFYLSLPREQRIGGLMAIRNETLLQQAVFLINRNIRCPKPSRIHAFAVGFQAINQINGSYVAELATAIFQGIVHGDKVDEGHAETLLEDVAIAYELGCTDTKVMVC